MSVYIYQGFNDGHFSTIAIVRSLLSPDSGSILIHIHSRLNNIDLQFNIPNYDKFTLCNYDKYIFRSSLKAFNGPSTIYKASTRKPSFFSIWLYAQKYTFHALQIVKKKILIFMISNEIPNACLYHIKLLFNCLQNKDMNSKMLIILQVEGFSAYKDWKNNIRTLLSTAYISQQKMSIINSILTFAKMIYFIQFVFY